MFSPDVMGTVRGIGAAMVGVANSPVVALAAWLEPWGAVTIATALFKLACAMVVPVGLVVATLMIGWWMPLPRPAGRDPRGTSTEERHVGA